MIKKFSDFKDYLCNAKLEKAIQDYSIIFILEKNELPDSFERNQLINQNIKNSKVIIINKCDLLNGNAKNEFLILCFEKTLIILKQSMISSIYTLLSNNSNLSVCFIKHTKEIFTEQIANPLIEYDEIFEEEIENLKNKLYLRKK